MRSQRTTSRTRFALSCTKQAFLVTVIVCVSSSYYVRFSSRYDEANGSIPQHRQLSVTSMRFDSVEASLNEIKSMLRSANFGQQAELVEKLDRRVTALEMRIAVDPRQIQRLAFADSREGLTRSGRTHVLS